MRPGKIPEGEAGGEEVAGAAMGAAGGAGTARARRKKSFRSARTPISSQRPSLLSASSPYTEQQAAFPAHVWHPIWHEKGRSAYIESQGLAASLDAKQRLLAASSDSSGTIRTAVSLQERVVQVSRVTKVVKGGKSMSFR